MDHENLHPIGKLYKEIWKMYGFSERTLQWYVTQGHLPKPIHQGKEAFYDLNECPIYDYILIIKILRDECKFSLAKIRKVLDNYRMKKEYIEQLNILLCGLVDHYPYPKTNYSNFTGRKKTQEPDRSHAFALKDNTVHRIREKVYTALYEGIDILRISLPDIEDEVEREIKKEKVTVGEDW